MPVALDGERLAPVALVERLHALGGKHGVGRIDHVEDRLVGIKSREIYEAPAATILHAAHHALEGLTLSRDTLRFNRLVADELSRLIYDGLWFSALSRDLRSYVASSQRVVSGEVRVRLDHGQAIVAGRRSPLSLYDKSLATYDEGDAFDHASAVGFIEIFGLPLRVEAARHGAVGAAPWGCLELDGTAARRAADLGHRPGAGRGLSERSGRANGQAVADSCVRRRVRGIAGGPRSPRGADDRSRPAPLPTAPASARRSRARRVRVTPSRRPSCQPLEASPASADSARWDVTTHHAMPMQALRKVPSEPIGRDLVATCGFIDVPPEHAPEESHA